MERVWCTKCKHGHEPIVKIVNGKETGICPCCDAPLSKDLVKTKEDQIRDFAKKIQFQGKIMFGRKELLVGVKDDIAEMPAVSDSCITKTSEASLADSIGTIEHPTDLSNYTDDGIMSTTGGEATYLKTTGAPAKEVKVVKKTKTKK